MSGNVLDGVVLPQGDIIRDFLNTQAGLVAGFDFDVPSTGNALGLDLFIHNRGAAALTIGINGQAPITVNAGAVYTLSGFKFWLIEVVSAVLYDLQIMGVRITTLRRLGIMPEI